MHVRFVGRQITIASGLGVDTKTIKPKKIIVPTGYTNGLLGFAIRLRLHFQRYHSTANVMVKPNAPQVKVANKNKKKMI